MIAYEYVQEHRVEFTNQDALKQEYLVRFNTKQQAWDYAKTQDGVVIHDQSGCYYVFPKEIEGRSVVVSYDEED